MSFGLFILLIFVIIIGIPLFRVFNTIRKLRKNYREMFGGGPRSSQGRRQSQPRQNTRPKREKIIKPDEGEYVEFEEITSTTQTFSDGGKKYTYTEEQVTDAEWEDIK